MRATFEGVYFVPPPVCLSKALAATRKTFKQQYDARQYAEARGTLEPVLSVCKRTLHWLDEARIRNDVAVTLHKLKEFSACQAVLAPLAEDAKLSDAGVRENYAPTGGRPLPACGARDADEPETLQALSPRCALP
jgi:hypothetical protein